MQTDASQDAGSSPSKPKQSERRIVGIPGLCLVAYSGGESFVYRFRHPITKKRVSKTLGRTQHMSLTQAAVIVEGMRGKIDAGRDPSEAMMTVSQGFDELYLCHIKKNLQSWSDHKSRFNVHVRPVIGAIPLCKVGQSELQRLVDNLKPVAADKTCLSDATVNRVTALLKAYFSRLVEWGVISSSPALRLRMLREQNQRRRIILDREMNGFFSALANRPPIFQLLVKLLLLTGVRLNEALSAQWQNIRLEGDKPTMWLPRCKGGRGRFVPLSPEAVDVIQQLGNRQDQEYLFPGSKGPMTRPGRHFKALFKEAGVEDLHCHDFRRHFGTMALAEGANVGDLKEIYGHQALSTTERYLAPQENRLHLAAHSVGQKLKAYL
ncbi:MAG: tyrosine-type recombinase/integrase [Propionivibrio sp.]